MMYDRHRLGEKSYGTSGLIDGVCRRGIRERLMGGSGFNRVTKNEQDCGMLVRRTL